MTVRARVEATCPVSVLPAPCHGAPAAGPLSRRYVSESATRQRLVVEY